MKNIGNIFMFVVPLFAGWCTLQVFPYHLEFPFSAIAFVIGAFITWLVLLVLTAGGAG